MNNLIIGYKRESMINTGMKWDRLILTNQRVLCWDEEQWVILVDQEYKGQVWNTEKTQMNWVNLIHLLSIKVTVVSNLYLKITISEFKKWHHCPKEQLLEIKKWKECIKNLKKWVSHFFKDRIQMKINYNNPQP